MATLSGQSIQNTYDGLLKLADSTTGITSTYQQIQDGLGNDTNSRISTSGIISPNVVGMSLNTMKADYYGPGFAAAGGANVAGIQLKTIYYPFYDTGNFSYSAITYNLAAITSTSDVITMAIYSAQLVPNIGIAPKDLIMSGITLTTTAPIGVKTTSLPSTLSFSGDGGGYYIAAFYVSNANVTPTARYTSANFVTNNQSYATSFGLFLTVAGTATQIGQKYMALGVQNLLNVGFQSTYTSADITTNYNTSIITQTTWGFALNTIR